MLNIKDFTIEYQPSPIGLDEKKPCFCYKLVSDKNNTVQKSYRLTVKAEGGVMYDSGINDGSQSLYIALKTCTASGTSHAGNFSCTGYPVTNAANPANTMKIFSGLIT
jgi:alpha-L-rhamnosidase